MNNSKTPKIVVGVGLAAVYATIAAFVIPRGTQDNVVAQAARLHAAHRQCSSICGWVST